MHPNRYIIYQCSNTACQFRFPAPDGLTQPTSCPKCGAEIRGVELEHPAQHVKVMANSTDGPIVAVLLDNIRSCFNVGSMFRAADGAGLSHVHLCGISPTPENPKVSKTALGSEFAVPWTYHTDGHAAVIKLKQEGFRIWALEGGQESQPIFSSVRQLAGGPLLLVVGNEVSGIDPGILALCDRVLSIPMEGFKRSLNVAVAFGIAVYFLRFGAQIGRAWENSETEKK